MDGLAPDTEELPPPKPKKKYPRYGRRGHIYKQRHGYKNPGSSEGMKLFWADPVKRAAHIAKIRGKKYLKHPRRGRPRSKRFSRFEGMSWVESRKLWKKSQRQARRTMEKLEDAGVLKDADPNAKEALRSALEVMRTPMSQQVKLAAAKLVLDFTMPKPVAKSEVTLNKAEDWLAAVVADAKASKAANAETEESEDDA